MHDDISQLLQQIHALENELEKRLADIREEMRYSWDDHKAKFSEEIRELHKRYRVGVWRYLSEVRLMTLLTAPVIYAMVVPLLMLDIAITLYQHICFRVYGIPRVHRRDYLLFDRHYLSYLNVIEKFNCAYCSYGNGLMAYAREIIALTEQHWCPIRHARKTPNPHHYYHRFFDYGDANGYTKELGALRAQSRQPPADDKPADG